MKKRLETAFPVYPAVSVLHRTLRSYIGAQRLKRLARVSPCRIVVGSSGVADRGWIPTDAEYLNLLQHRHWEYYFQEGSIDAILAEHVWEHLEPQDGLRAAQVCYRFLKNGSYLRVAVPDGFHPDSTYIDEVKPNGRGAGSQDHKVLYTYKSFRQLFEEAGFQVTLYEYFDEEGKFHAAPWETAQGTIRRSWRFDKRNAAGRLSYTSIILDAVKRD